MEPQKLGSALFKSPRIEELIMYGGQTSNQKPIPNEVQDQDQYQSGKSECRRSRIIRRMSLANTKTFLRRAKQGGQFRGLFTRTSLTGKTRNTGDIRDQENHREPVLSLARIVGHTKRM